MRKQKGTDENIPARRYVVDLYSGIGGLGLGAARAGFELALSVDTDPLLSSINEVNFPRVSHSKCDVSRLTAGDILRDASVQPGELTGLIGGSPCQGFSRIGKRDLADERNKLFVHFFRLVSELKPAFYLAENVQGILDDQNKDIVKSALDLVRKDYQLLDPIELNAADFGAATNRKRVFFIGYLPDECDPLTKADFENARWKTKSTVELALSDLPVRLKKEWRKSDKAWTTLSRKRRGNFWDKIHGEIPEGIGDPGTVTKFKQENMVSGCVATNHTGEVVERFRKVKEGETDAVSRMPRLKRDGLCPTLRAGTGSDKGSYMALRPIHFSEPRVITPREAARLQGFPDWFRFHKTKWHSFRGIGNSVSPFVAEAIFRVIYSKLKTVDSKEETNGNRPKAKAHHVGT